MLKRTFDFVFALVALILLSLPMALIAVLVRYKIGPPILFRQRRPGIRGQPFEMVKFRTMHDTRDSRGRLLSDGERLTSFGKFLRASSIDELPELWNVLKGEMSIVGPRPLLVEYLPLYSESQARRHEVRPGITGWAQVNGRNSISWDEKFALDVWYVDNRSMILDLKVIWLTFLRVLVRDGISAKGEATMPLFSGGRTRGEDGE